MITVDVTSAKMMLSAIEAKLSVAGTISFLASDVYLYLSRRAAIRFGNEGSDTGGWRDLALSTVHTRQALGFPGAHPINRRTGDLRNAVLYGTPHFVAMGAGYTEMHFPGNDSFNTGTLRHKVNTAQFGNKNGAPARPVLYANMEDATVISQMYARFLSPGSF